MKQLLYGIVCGWVAIIFYIFILDFSGYEISQKPAVENSIYDVTMEECQSLSVLEYQSFDWQWSRGQCWGLLHRTEVAIKAMKNDVERMERAEEMSNNYKNVKANIIDL